MFTYSSRRQFIKLTLNCQTHIEKAKREGISLLTPFLHKVNDAIKVLSISYRSIFLKKLLEHIIEPSATLESCQELAIALFDPNDVKAEETKSSKKALFSLSSSSPLVQFSLSSASTSASKKQEKHDSNAEEKNKEKEIIKSISVLRELFAKNLSFYEKLMSELPGTYQFLKDKEKRSEFVTNTADIIASVIEEHFYFVVQDIDFKNYGLASTD